MRTTIGSAHGTLSQAGGWRTALPWSLWSLGVVVTLVLSMFVVAHTAAAPPRATAARIAFLGFGLPPSAAEPRPVVEEFRHALRERGWIESDNLTIEWRWTAGGLNQFAILVAEVIRLQVEVIVVPYATAAGIAKQATSTIPIVVMGGGLLESGLVASLARPGGNVTGVSTLNPEVVTKRLELLKQVVLGLTRLAELALASRLPTMSGETGYAEAGGLMYYGPDIPGSFRRVAVYVDKILKGAQPADLPVEQPTTFELAINRKTAQALGLTIPSVLLFRANKLIQ